MDAVLVAKLMGAIFGLLAVVFGAFGAHALKKKLTPELLLSFETGVRYQMYHAIVLLVLGCGLVATGAWYTGMVYCFVLGTFLFSFSIYGLCLSAAKGNKLRFLGPITPLGGLLLVVGWAILIYAICSSLL